MKVVVTGANGFIGSYLCNFLLKNNCEVTGISRKFFPEIRKKLEGAELITSDVLSEEFINLKLSGVDAIVHLASSNDIISKKLLQGIELSAVGTVNALKFAHLNAIPKFIFYSTLQVYGTELAGEYDETKRVKPENDYAMNHLFGEMYAEMFSRKAGIKTVVARPSNIYGDFLTPEIDRWTLVPGCFCKEAIEKGTITLLSSGKQNRNFISLEQLSYATLQTLKNMHKPFDVLNYITNDFKSIVEVAQLTQKIFREKYNKEIKLNIGSDMPVEKNSFVFSTEKLKEYMVNPDETSQNCNLETEISKTIGKLLGNS